MGRHSSVTQRRNNKSPIVIVSALVVLALVGWFVFAFVRDKLDASGCAGTPVVNVTAAPEIAPVIAQIGKKASDEAGNCFKVNVTTQDPATTSDSLVVNDQGTDRPDVWVPDSTIWLHHAQSAGAWNTQVTGTPLASTPVVIAVTRDTADRLGWPQKAPTWSDVVASGTPVGFPDPARDATGAAALFGVKALADASPDPGGTLAATLRLLSPNTVAGSNDLFSRLPGGGSPLETLNAFPATEVSVLRNNVRNPGAMLVAVYPPATVPALDYPFAILPTTTPAVRSAAEKFQATLLDMDTSAALGDAGFRAPDGKALRDRSQDHRTSATPLTSAPTPSDDQVDEILNTWAGVNLSSRALILVDVSGSMNQQIPGTGQTRMAATLQALSKGLTLFKPTSKVAFWEFSTRLDGDKDYKEILPMRTVAEQAAGGAAATLAGVRAVEGGATGLYDSVLAAYQNARQNWEAGRINTIVLFTDGRNEDPNGISRAQLLAEMAKLADPHRPIPIIAIGFGPDVDAEELAAIAGASGGGQAFTATDPAKINEIFYQALAKISCQPPMCTRTGG